MRAPAFINYSGFAALFLLALPLGGIAVAALAVALLLLLAGPKASTLTLILAGVAVSSLAGAPSALALNLSPNPYAAMEILFWMMGSLADRSFEHVRRTCAFMLPGWALLLSCSRALDALSTRPQVSALVSAVSGSLPYSGPRWRWEPLSQ